MQLANWMQSYRPEELFDNRGVLRPEVAGLAPRTERAIGGNPHANGGLLIRELDLPEVDQYAVPVGSPGAMTAEATTVLGSYLRDVIGLNPNNFRLMGPDETASIACRRSTNAPTRCGWNVEKPPTNTWPPRAG